MTPLDDQCSLLHADTDSVHTDTDDAINDKIVSLKYRKKRISNACVLIFVGVITVLVVALLAQGVYLAQLLSKQEMTVCSNDLGLINTVERKGYIPTRYMSENETDASVAWNAIQAGHGLVAVTPEYATEHHLPKTLRHPLESSKIVYVIEAYHNMHCVKTIREHYVALLSGEQIDWSLEPLGHDLHCFDALRQYIMCTADDTLLYTTGHRDSGVNQTRQCRNWDALRDWATERTACYYDYVPPAGERSKGATRWGKCDGGDDGLPRGSLLE